MRRYPESDSLNVNLTHFLERCLHGTVCFLQNSSDWYTSASPCRVLFTIYQELVFCFQPSVFFFRTEFFFLKSSDLLDLALLLSFRSFFTERSSTKMGREGETEEERALRKAAKAEKKESKEKKFPHFTPSSEEQ